MSRQREYLHLNAIVIPSYQRALYTDLVDRLMLLFDVTDVAWLTRDYRQFAAAIALDSVVHQLSNDLFILYMSTICAMLVCYDSL
jgi:hypothetical protein